MLLLQENADDFSGFLTIISQTIQEKNINNACFFMDNASIHREKDILERVEYYNLHYKHNVNYSIPLFFFKLIYENINKMEKNSKIRNEMVRKVFMF